MRSPLRAAVVVVATCVGCGGTAAPASGGVETPRMSNEREPLVAAPHNGRDADRALAALSAGGSAQVEILAVRAFLGGEQRYVVVLYGVSPWLDWQAEQRSRDQLDIALARIRVCATMCDERMETGRVDEPAYHACRMGCYPTPFGAYGGDMSRCYRLMLARLTDDGDVLRAVRSVELEEAACDVTVLVAIGAGDIDGDVSSELIVRYAWSVPRDGTEHADAPARSLAVVGFEPFHEELGLLLERYPWGPRATTLVARARFVRTPGSGRHDDVVVDRILFTASECQPRVLAPLVGASDVIGLAEQCGADIVTEVWRYSPERDRWEPP